VHHLFSSIVIDVETILKGIGSGNEQKTQCLMFSATTPPWVKQIGRQYQEDVLAIDSTGDEGGARVATTVRHTAIQLPPGSESKMAILEDIIAVEISRDKAHDKLADDVDDNKESAINPIAAAAKAKKAKHHNSMQQKIFGKTIVFVETKKLADELVSGNVFKSLTAQALHGDVGQKQRDATLNAFRSGAFNVLVATDVAARGIDIKDVDLVVQFDPPRDVDSYVHRSGRTGRAGNRGVSVLLFNRQQSRDIVRIERDLGHGFKFDLVGPPSPEAALRAAARTSAMACQGIPEDTVEYFKESAAALLEEYDNPQDVIARCLAAISRRATEVQSRSLITGELGLATLEMKAAAGRAVAPNEVMFTVGKLSRLSQNVGGDVAFENDIGKIQTNPDTGSVFFDMSIEEAKKLVEFSKDVDAGGAQFSLVKEMEIERDRFFGTNRGDRRGGGGGDDYNGGRFGGASRGGYGGASNFRRNSFGRDNSHTGRSNRYGGGRDYEGGGGSRGRYQGGESQRWEKNDGYQGGGSRRYESTSAGAYQNSGQGRGKYGSKGSGGGDSGWYK
jgi:ATP-dependent RNA helicase DDX21